MIHALCSVRDRGAEKVAGVSRGCWLPAVRRPVSDPIVRARAGRRESGEFRAQRRSASRGRSRAEWGRHECQDTNAIFYN